MRLAKRKQILVVGKVESKFTVRVENLPILHVHRGGIVSEISDNLCEVNFTVVWRDAPRCSLVIRVGIVSQGVNLVGKVGRWSQSWWVTRISQNDIESGRVTVCKWSFRSRCGTLDGDCIGAWYVRATDVVISCRSEHKLSIIDISIQNSIEYEVTARRDAVSLI